MNKHQERLAAIDIGTNAMRLIIAEANESKGSFKIINRERETIRLGSGSTNMKHISNDAMTEAIGILSRFKSIVDAKDARLRTVATSAVREAGNQEEFLKRVFAELKIKVEVISGFEEARLIYLGILRSLPVFDKSTLLIDIGGGSTEFLIGERSNVLFANSLKIGAVRLTERFFKNDNVDSKSIKECKRFIVGMLATIKRQTQDITYDVVVGASGTILTIANMVKEMRGDTGSGLNNFIFSNEELFKVADNIFTAANVKARTKLRGIDPDRADIIVAGTLILQEIVKEFKIKEIVTSEYALKEGVIADMLEKRHSSDVLTQLEDIRKQSVIGLASNFKYESLHSHHVSLLATKIFDQTTGIHRFGSKEREILEYAAILHDIGLFISHSQHHRHSYYIIRNSELLGFSENEKEIIANVARYHRKSHPKPIHEGFSRLDKQDQHLVKILSSILRIADGLDRRHISAVKNVRCEIQAKSIIFYVKANFPNIELELWGAEQKKGLLEHTFDISCAFEREKS